MHSSSLQLLAGHFCSGDHATAGASMTWPAVPATARRRPDPAPPGSRRVGAGGLSCLHPQEALPEAHQRGTQAHQLKPQALGGMPRTSERRAAPACCHRHACIQGQHMPCQGEKHPEGCTGTRGGAADVQLPGLAGAPLAPVPLAPALPQAPPGAFVPLGAPPAHFLHYTRTSPAVWAAPRAVAAGVAAPTSLRFVLGPARVATILEALHRVCGSHDSGPAAACDLCSGAPPPAAAAGQPPPARYPSTARAIPAVCRGQGRQARRRAVAAAPQPFGPPPQLAVERIRGRGGQA